MRFVYLIMSVALCFSAMAKDCGRNEMYGLSGVFQVLDYQCDIQNSEYATCKDEQDSFQKVVKVEINPYFLVHVLGVEAKLLADATTVGVDDELIAHYVLLNSDLEANETFSCTTSGKDRKKRIELMVERAFGSFRLYTKIIKEGDKATLTMFSSMGEMTSSQTLILKSE